MSSKVNLFSDVGSWQRKKLHISFSKLVKSCTTCTRANSERADIPLRKSFVCYKFNPIPERCEFFLNARCFFRAFCRRVVKQRKWTEKLGILCRCICEGRGTSIHRCRKSSRVVQNVNQTAICEFEGQPVFRRRKLTDRRTSHFFLEICHNLRRIYSRQFWMCRPPTS